MNMKKIVIDGKTYNSVDEMPEEVRRNYEEAIRNFSAGRATNAPADNDNDGVPDVMKNARAINLSGGMKFIVDGKTYNSVDELPPDARAKYEQALGNMDRNQNGMPDFLEGMLNVSTQTPPMTTTYEPAHPDHSFFDTSKDKPMIVKSAIEPEPSGGWAIAILSIVLLAGLCIVGAAGVWYFLLR